MKKARKIFTLASALLLGTSSIYTLSSCNPSPGYKWEQNTFDKNAGLYKDDINKINVYGSFILDNEFKQVEGTTLMKKIVGKNSKGEVAYNVYIGKAKHHFLELEIMVGVDVKTNLITGVTNRSSELHTYGGEKAVLDYMKSLIGTDGGSPIQSGHGSAATLSNNAIQLIAKESVLETKGELKPVDVSKGHTIDIVQKKIILGISHLYPKPYGYLKIIYKVDGKEITDHNNSIFVVSSSNSSVVRVDGTKYEAVGKGEATITVSLKEFPNVKDTVPVTVTKEDIGNEYTNAEWQNINAWLKEENGTHNDKLYRFTGRFDCLSEGSFPALYNAKADTLNLGKYDIPTQNRIPFEILGGIGQEDIIEKQTNATYQPNPRAESNLSTFVADSYKNKQENKQKLYPGDNISVIGIMNNGKFYGFVEQINAHTTETDITLNVTGSATTDDVTMQINPIRTTGGEIITCESLTNIKVKYQDFIILTARNDITVKIGQEAAVELKKNKEMKIYTVDNPFDTINIKIEKA